MKCAVVTGGAGFVGSHLCDYLLATGARVVCVDNLITGNRANIRHHEGDGRFRFIEQDINEPYDVDEPVDFIFHFASPASPFDYLAHPIETMKVGSLGTLHTLEVARQKGAGLLMASTSEIYGDPLVHPQTEGYFGNVNTIGPRSVYDEAKRFSEALVMAYHRTHGVDTRIVRIFNTYGPRMRPRDGRVVPAFIGAALRGEPLTIFGDGSQTRSFCYVSDLVEGVYRLACSQEHLPTNIGNPDERTILEFARLIEELTGAKSEIVFQPAMQDDPKQRRPDITKAKRVLGWEPKVDLREGLAKTIEYFRS